MEPRNLFQVMLELQKMFPSEDYLELLPRHTWNGNSSKCSSSAERHRLVGNILFKKKEFKSALEYYNLSLCYALPGSTCVSLVYGNRSAVYCMMGKYALAIENIKWARENGYPAEKMATLHEREEKCKKLMEKLGGDRGSIVNTFFKLSHPANEKIPFIVDCLQLRKNEKYGRHIITTKDLKTGDIIAIESPAFAWPAQSVSGYVCFFCTRPNSGSLIPCSHCTTVMYCSEDCRLKAAGLHLNDKIEECFHTKVAEKMQLESFRIAGGVNEALELLKDCENKTIFDFDFSDSSSYEKNMLVALNGLYQDLRCLEDIRLKPCELLNIPPINEKPRTIAEYQQLLKFAVSQFKICNVNLGRFQTSHFGIYPFKQLMSHSCFPEIECFTLGEKLVSIVARPVKAGQQIFCSYGAYAKKSSKKERATFLQNHGFKCDCVACVNDYQLPFPRKDDYFIEPIFDASMKPEEAIEQFKKNCKYIDDNAHKMPCYEVSRLIQHNSNLTRLIGYEFRS